MPYTKVHEAWEDLPSTNTPINAAALDQIEAGIATAQTAAEAAALASDLTAHLNDTVDAHDATAVSFSPTGTVAATTVQAAIAEVSGDVTTAQSTADAAGSFASAHINDTAGAHAASAISFTPTGTIAASDVQAAIAELASESTGLVDTVVAGTGIDVDATDPANPVVAIESGVYRSGGTDVAVVDGGTGSSTAAGARTNLGLGTMAVEAAADYVAKATFPEVLIIAISDETTAITTGPGKVTFRMPFAMTLTAVRASLTTASSSGTPTFDVNEGGVSVLSTKLTIDVNEKTSTTAAAAAVISDSALADDAEITIDVDTAGTGAAGAKIYLIGTRAV